MYIVGLKIRMKIHIGNKEIVGKNVQILLLLNKSNNVQ